MVNVGEIGFFGITSNPPHFGHLKVVQKALEKFKEVWISPVYIHPFGKNTIPYEQRLELTYLMFKDIMDKNISIREIDKEYHNKYNKTPYSYNLLQYLKSEYKVNPTLILGADNYHSDVWKKFYKHHEIEKDFGVCIFPDIGIHSSTIRQLITEEKWLKIEVACGRNIADYLRKNVNF